MKETPSLRDRSAPVKEELVRQNAISVVRVRGGDATDPAELLGEYWLQFGRYKGKSFRWLLENDVGYTLYLLHSHQREEAAGVVMTEGPSKDSVMSFLRYALSFKEIKDLLQYEAKKSSVPAPASEDDQLVGFGARASSTWREVWESREDGYAAFVLKSKCAAGTKMHKLQQFLQRQKQLSSSPVSSSSVSSSVPSAPAPPLSVSSSPLPTPLSAPSPNSSLSTPLSPPSLPPPVSASSVASTSVSITSSAEPMGKSTFSNKFYTTLILSLLWYTIILYCCFIFADIEEDEELERSMLSISTEHIDTCKHSSVRSRYFCVSRNHHIFDLCFRLVSPSSSNKVATAIRFREMFTTKRVLLGHVLVLCMCSIVLDHVPVTFCSVPYVCVLPKVQVTMN